MNTLYNMAKTKSCEKKFKILRGKLQEVIKSRIARCAVNLQFRVYNLQLRDELDSEDKSKNYDIYTCTNRLRCALTVEAVVCSLYTACHISSTALACRNEAGMT